ncbi:MAG: DMT family transporter [Myxococcales bacterium]|nr:MAG: DMT family transporter [Myxococcales bacterium]
MTRAAATAAIRPILYGLLAAFLFGASTPAAKHLLHSVGPATLAGLLYLGAALAVLPFVRRGGSAELRRQPRCLLCLASAVLFGGVIGPFLLMAGLRLAPSASTSLWLNLETVATSLLAWLFFREHMGPRAWLAAALIIAAGAILAAPSDFALGWPAALVALACVAWGLDNNFTALIDGFTPAQSTLAKGLIAGMANLAIGHALGEPRPEAALLAGALAVGALGYGLSLVLYVSCAQAVGAARSQLIFSASPFIGVLLAWIALGESLSTGQLVAAGLVAVALAAVFSGGHVHAHHHRTLAHTHAHAHDDEHHTHSHPDLPPNHHHTHAHAHEETRHVHPHHPDLHHRHGH